MVSCTFQSEIAVSTSKPGKERHWKAPRTGAVFRCFPDGSQLEVVHRGLRNPQEIAFDDYGNLFAADNNCDKGDHSRLVYIVEGGDSGWNMAFQSIPDPYLTGPWHAERLWHLYHPGQPAWIVPPVGKLGAGPSGFCYYPGTGLPERYRGQFFLCNYTGNGGIEAIATKPSGAGFEITGQTDFLKPVFATDAEFGYDGKLYVSDFVALDWNGASKGGRIYTVHDPATIQQPVVQQMKKLFQQGFRDRPTDELLSLLAHPDQRVRLRSQFTLAGRGTAVIPQLLNITLNNESLLARLHAIWGLGQFQGPQPEIEAGLLPLLTDSASEIRAQTAKVFGQQRWKLANDKLVELLTDPEPRVRFFAAQALGQNQHHAAFPALVKLIRENQDADPFLRYAGVVALWNLNNRANLLELIKDPSASVRMAVLLILRRLRDDNLFQFLEDSDPLIVTEAARAINDLPLDGQMSRLTEPLRTLNPETVPEPLLRRILNAHFRIGHRENAQAVARVIINPRIAPELRVEALDMLAMWTEPGQRDRVTGFWRPLDKRDPAVVQAVLGEYAMPILTFTSGELQISTIELLTRLKVAIDDEVVLSWVNGKSSDVLQRVAALQLLAARKNPQLPQILEAALQNNHHIYRAAARKIIATQDPERGVKLFKDVILKGPASMVESQQALQLLAAMNSSAADQVIQATIDQLLAGKLPPELHVDVIEAARYRGTPELNASIAKYEASLPAGDPLARYRIALSGGNIENGHRLFRSHTVAQCFRCHKVQGQGGEAGPDLTQLAGRATREHILESMIDPNAKLAPGFGSVAYVLTDGRVIAGILKAEDPQQVTVLTPEGKSVVIPVSDIDERTAAKSAMPPVGPILKLSEIRDVIEYLATLK